MFKHYEIQKVGLFSFRGVLQKGLLSVSVPRDREKRILGSKKLGKCCIHDNLFQNIHNTHMNTKEVLESPTVKKPLKLVLPKFI